MKTLILITNTIFLTLFIAIFLYGCTENNAVNNGTSSGPLILNGTIENWSHGGNIKLKAEVFDTSGYPNLVLDSNIIGIGGAFSLKLKNVPDSLLYSIIFHSDSSYIINVDVNPANTKSNFSPCLMYPRNAPYGLDLYNDSLFMGFIYRSNYDPDTIFFAGWYYTFYLYLNQNVRITGSTIHNYLPYHDTVIYDLSGIQGWNKVVVFVNSYTDYTLKVTISANEPTGGKWHAYTYTSDLLSGKSFIRQHLFRLNNKLSNR
jgi:hypothetical protein